VCESWGEWTCLKMEVRVMSGSALHPRDETTASLGAFSLARHLSLEGSFRTIVFIRSP